MDNKRKQNPKTYGQVLTQRKQDGSVLIQDQPAVDELCKILARILRRVNDDSPSSIIN